VERVKALANLNRDALAISANIFNSAESDDWARPGREPTAALRWRAAGSGEPSERLTPFIDSSRGQGRRKGLRVRELIEPPEIPAREVITDLTGRFRKII
jgi:hypothetical protein